MTSIIALGNATRLPFPDESIPCIVSSPPYNMGIKYDGYNDRITWDEYLHDLIEPAVAEMERVLVPGGRLWLNLPTNAPYADRVEERADVARLWANVLQDQLRYRDTIIWHQDSHDGGCQWGSWLRPSSPNVRGEYEVLLCFFKKQWKRTAPVNYEKWQAPRSELGGDWTDLCRNVWSIAPERSKWSPAGYPLDIPARCIRLSTWPEEVVLDPFGGGGTTALAADILGRTGISLDISQAQTAITQIRLADIFGG